MALGLSVLLAVNVKPAPVATEVATADTMAQTQPEPEPPAMADAEPTVVPLVPEPVVREVAAETPPPPEEAPVMDAEREPAGQAGAEEDPLDAVMRDALAAAEAGKVDTFKADAVDAELASASEAPPAVPTTKSVPEEDDQAMPEVAPEPPVEAKPPQTAKVPEKPPAAVEPAVETQPAPQPAAVADTDTQADAEPSAESASEPVGAPVESREIPKQPPVVTAKPTVVVPAVAAPSGGDAWLKSRDPAHFTLQLVGSRDRAAVRKFVREHAISAPHAIFERDLKGKPWYSLVAGDYPDRAAAIAARERLPSSLGRSGIWPRTFGSIQNLK